MNVFVNALRSMEIAVDNKTHIHHSWDFFYYERKVRDMGKGGTEKEREISEGKKRWEERGAVPLLELKEAMTKRWAPDLIFTGHNLSLFNLLHSLFFRVKDFSGNGNVLAFNLSDKISISSLCFLPSLQFWGVWHLFCQCGWPKAFASLFPSLSLSHSRFQMGHSQLKSNGAAVQLTSKNCFLSCQVSKFHALEELHPAVKKSHHFLIVTSQLIFYNWFWCIYINGDWVCFPLFHWFACGLKRL